jgi:cell pole-organizing protein PopZ
MGTSGSNSSVEDILASIRQAISDDDARRTQERARMNSRPSLPTRGQPERQGAVARETPVEDAVVAPEPEAAGGEAGPDQDVIERAIEQALDSVRAELEASAPRLVQPARAHKVENGAQAAPAAQRAIPRARVSAARNAEAFSPRRALMSSDVGASVTASFDELTRAMVSGNARKLDEVVEEILRPMLKTWLDSNLPQMVERMVREEIERVARGRR